VSITRRTTARLLLGVLVAAVGTVAAVLGAATPASAHGQFVSSDPAKDSTVSMPLATIVVYFTEKPTSNAFFSVTAPSGARVDRLWSHGSTRHLDEPVHEYYHNTDGNWETRRYDTAYSALIPIAYWPEAGVYKVSFVSVATDGEPVRGEFSFTYDGALSPAPPDFRPQKNEPDPNLLAVVKTDQPTAPPSAGPEQAAQAAEDSGPGVWIVLVPVALALIVAAVIFVFWRLRPDAARSILVSRFGGRYAPAPPPRKPLPSLKEIQDKLPGIKRR
jgi:methionine-rich copper-binding protein CopC